MSGTTTYGYLYSGTVVVNGADSMWTNSSNLFVGYSGNGTLTIETGGQVSNFHGFVGYNSSSTGTATVTGAGSEWTNYGLYIGYEGSGTLTIEDGGLVSISRGALTIDSRTPGDSFINMTTGGMLALRGDADDSLSQFLGLVQGTDAIRYWDDVHSEWAPLTSATLGEDYTLEYLTSGDLAFYTLLTVGETISPGIEGDFDNDGDVDGRDFLIWQRGGSPNPLSAGDLADWQAHYGETAELASLSVPEPSALLLVLAPIAVSLGERRVLRAITR